MIIPSISGFRLLGTEPREQECFERFHMSVMLNDLHKDQLPEITRLPLA